MNACFKADGVANDALLELNAIQAKVDRCNVVGSTNRAREEAVSLLTGARGLAAVDDLLAMLNTGRQLVPDSADELASVHQLAMISLGETWRRLVFPFSAFPWLLFSLLGKDVNVEERAKEFTGALKRCRSCFTTFAAVVVDRLGDVSQQAATLALLEDVALACRPTSLSVERQPCEEDCTVCAD